MNIRLLSQLFSFRDLRNAILGTSVVFGGIGLSLLTLWAHRSGDPRLAGILAGISLLFVLLILIFVIPPLARNAGREASQMDLPFEITSGGAIMLGLIVIVGFSAWNTGNNLLFLVLSFLAAAMAVGFVAGSISLKKLEVGMRFPETIFAGEETPILVSIRNRKRLFASYSVVVEVRGAERERSIAADELAAMLPSFIASRLSRPPLLRRTLDHFAYIPRNSFEEHRVMHQFDRRGRVLIKDFEISTRFPFGAVRHRRRLPAREAELYVFPAIEPFDDAMDRLESEAGRLTANRRGLGQDLLALREYQPNDDLRRVDWKATARSRTLTVREFAADDDKRITVFLDTVLPADDENRLSLREKIELEQRGASIPVNERFESGVSLAASALVRFTDEQAELRLAIGGQIGDFGIGSRHLHDCLQRLAVAEPVFAGDPNSNEPNELRERILNETGRSFRILITANMRSDEFSDLPQRLKILGF